MEFDFRPGYCAESGAEPRLIMSEIYLQHEDAFGWPVYLR